MSKELESKRAPSQDQNDPRPYLEFVLFAVLLGGDSQHFDIVADSIGFDEKVCIRLQLFFYQIFHYTFFVS